MMWKLILCVLSLFLFEILFYRKCSSKEITTHTNTRFLQNDDPNVEQEILVNVVLNGKDGQLVVNTPYFSAGLEQSLKDYLNSESDCDGSSDIPPSYLGIDLDY